MEDLFKYFGEILNPDREKNIINAFLLCDKNSEVNEIVNLNIDYLNANPRLWLCARNARRRIARIRREKFKSYNINLN
jgi:hypothetical protein